MTLDTQIKRPVYFPFPLRGEIFDRGDRIRLLEPFVYRDEEKEIIVTIPAGFESDYNSVPPGFWNVFPPWEYPEAAIVHDWLYKHPQGLYKPLLKDSITLTRRQVDDIHRRILDLLGASWIKRQSMWLGIRSGGAWSWRKYRKSLDLTDSGSGEPTESIKAEATEKKEEGSVEEPPLPPT